MLKKISKQWLVVCLLIAVLVMGADLKESTGVTRLSRTTSVAMGSDATVVTLYTIPVGKSCIITKVIVHTLGGAVACGSNNDFGDGAARDTWKTDVDLSSLNTTAEYYVVTADDTTITATFDAGDTFGISTDEDSDASTVSATIDVFGYLF